MSFDLPSFAIGVAAGAVGLVILVVGGLGLMGWALWRNEQPWP